jgi:hypothetical protein
MIDWGLDTIENETIWALLIGGVIVLAAVASLFNRKP